MLLIPTQYKYWTQTPNSWKHAPRLALLSYTPWTVRSEAAGKEQATKTRQPTEIVLTDPEEAQQLLGW